MELDREADIFKENVSNVINTSLNIFEELKS
jgi:hypothetical protein